MGMHISPCIYFYIISKDCLWGLHLGKVNQRSYCFDIVFEHVRLSYLISYSMACLLIIQLSLSI